MIEALFLDLDGTLLDDDGGMRIAVPCAAEELARRHASVNALSLAAAYMTVSDEWWTRLGAAPTTPHGLATGHAVREATWAEALTRVGADPRWGSEGAALYAVERDRTYTPFPEVISLLEGLRGQVRFGVITNGASDTQRGKLRGMGVERYFDALIVSGEVGVGKPDSAIFDAALRALGATPSESAHVGDNPLADVGGARGAGMRAVWVNRTGATLPPGASRPDAEMACLCRLPEALGLPGLGAGHFCGMA